MKKSTKLVALFLAGIMVFSAMIIPASANTDVSDPGEQKLYTVLDKVVNGLVNAITATVIGPRLQSVDDYEAANFYEGSGDFLTEPAEGAKWSLGYANASIQDGKELDGEHFVGGSLSVTRKVATEVRDDQKVRTIAVSDGRGITVFAVLDAFGFANNSVQEVRSRFQKIADAKGWNITSVNISTLHQHSCVDTFGMNGDIANALFTAQFKNLLGQTPDSGINPDFQEHLYQTVTDTMVKAVNDMTEGDLYYGSVDVSNLMYDKRDPQVFDGRLNRLRFVPADQSEETWLVQGSMHCVGYGAANTLVTGDYPYYMEKYINENANANLMYILGAELAITSEYDSEADKIIPDADVLKQYNDERYACLAAYGTKLAQKVISINNDTAVAPILNIKHSGMFVTVNNAIFKFAAKFGLLTNTVLKDGLQVKVASEVGYCEFGKDLAIAIIPGELAPEIAFGGAMQSGDELNWTGENWDYPSFKEMVGSKNLMVFGLTNDQVGYILTDNSWHSIFTENEEIVATGNAAGSCITEAFQATVKEAKAKEGAAI